MSERSDNMNKNNTNNDFSKGSIAKNILNLSIPMTIAQFVNVLYNIVDRIYIGRLPNNSTLALRNWLMPSYSYNNNGLCQPFRCWWCSSLFYFQGEGNKEKAETIMGNSFALLLVLVFYLHL